MRYKRSSEWDTKFEWGSEMWRFVHDIDRLDKAHKRAKKALRQQQKCIKRLKWVQEGQQETIHNLEFEILLLKLENEKLKEEQTSSERVIQERIIKTILDDLCDTRTQLIEMEDKYLKLLKC